MFKDEGAYQKYIEENYPEVTDSRKDDSHFDLLCDACKVVRGFQVIKRANTEITTTYSGTDDPRAPRSIYFRCPVCHAFKLWIVFMLPYSRTSKEGTIHFEKMFRVTSLPNEGIEDIDELPEEPKALRTAYRQAIRAMDSNAHIAAAAMFRRAVQVITRQMLKITSSSLANELNNAVGMKYNGVTITNNFSEVGYIVKDAGNQGAHPDKDPDLLDFTKQDAEDLRNIFLDLVSELFIAPEAAKKAKEDFMKRRKISAKQSTGSKPPTS